jgi:hypothetical protein
VVNQWFSPVIRIFTGQMRMLIRPRRRNCCSKSSVEPDFESQHGIFLTVQGPHRLFGPGRKGISRCLKHSRQ